MRGPFARSFYASLDGVLTIGDSNADQYCRFGVPRELQFYCPIPVDGQSFERAVPDRSAARRRVRAALGIPTAAFVFASVGKYVPRKHHPDAAQAWLRLPPAVRDRSRLLFIGEGKDRPLLEAAANRAGGGIIVMGFINQSEMPGYLSACDALIVASEHDPHPLVVSEALFFGIPTIASDRVGCIGPNDTVREDVTGMSFPVGNIDELSQRMNQIVTTPGLHAKLSRGAASLAPIHDSRNSAKLFSQACIDVVCRQLPTTLARVRQLLSSGFSGY